MTRKEMKGRMSTKSNITVIGAGIGGLALAGLLGRWGARATGLQRIGAAIQMSPNAIRVLRALASNRNCAERPLRRRRGWRASGIAGITPLEDAAVLCRCLTEIDDVAAAFQSYEATRLGARHASSSPCARTLGVSRPRTRAGLMVTMLGRWYARNCELRANGPAARLRGFVVS